MYVVCPVQYNYFKYFSVLYYECGDKFKKKKILFTNFKAFESQGVETFLSTAQH